MSYKASKGLTDYNQMAMGLPPVTSVVFLIANSYLYNMGVKEEHLRCLYYPFGDKA
jgi:hypothetical protein